MNQGDAKIEDIKMTNTQYEQLFKVMDASKSGYIEPAEIPNVLKAYETWLYEKEYKKTMEELYAKNAKEDALLFVQHRIRHTITNHPCLKLES